MYFSSRDSGTPSTVPTGPPEVLVGLNSSQFWLRKTQLFVSFSPFYIFLGRLARPWVCFFWCFELIFSPKLPCCCLLPRGCLLFWLNSNNRDLSFSLLLSINLLWALLRFATYLPLRALISQYQWFFLWKLLYGHPYGSFSMNIPLEASL